MILLNLFGTCKFVKPEILKICCFGIYKCSISLRNDVVKTRMYHGGRTCELSMSKGGREAERDSMNTHKVCLLVLQGTDYPLLHASRSQYLRAFFFYQLSHKLLFKHASFLFTHVRGVAGFDD